MNRAKLAPTDNIAAYLTVALKNTLFNALKKTTDSLSFDEIGEREETVDESPSSPETIYINNEQEKQVQATVHTMMSVRQSDSIRSSCTHCQSSSGYSRSSSEHPTDDV